MPERAQLPLRRDVGEPSWRATHLACGQSTCAVTWPRLTPEPASRMSLAVCVGGELDEGPGNHLASSYRCLRGTGISNKVQHNMIR